MDLSYLGFGTWATSKKGWKGVNEEEAIETMLEAYELGINFYDTAPIYGFGKSEELIGKYLYDKRKNIIIASKCGLIWDNFGKVSHLLSSDSIKREIEASLKRLNTDYIDIYQIHWNDNKTPFEEIFKILNQLKDQKIIREIGICNFNKENLQKSLNYAKIFSVQDKYNILEREAEKEIIPFCKKNNIKFIAYSPLAQGLLTNLVDREYKFSKNGDIRKLNPIFQNQEIFELKEKIEKPVNKTALKFIKENKNVEHLLISMTKKKHLYENFKILIK